MSIAPKSLCPTCGTEMKAVINGEARNFNEEEDFHYDCITCGYRYSYVTEVVIEADLKDSPKSLCCPICDRHFNVSSALKRHLVAHTGERPFCCKVCEKSFKTKAALKRHEIIHTGECPFECSTCKKRFNQISNLRKHLVIHNNNCPFCCDVCGKGFNQLSNLKKHMVVHREMPDCGDKPKIPDSKKSVTRPVLTYVKPAEL